MGHLTRDNVRISTVLLTYCHRRDDEPLDYRVLNRSTSRIAD
jgi:hypothetical protein